VADEAERQLAAVGKRTHRQILIANFVGAVLAAASGR
jgi:hypothetical protein